MWRVDTSMAKELDSGRVLCEQCGNDYKKIGSHWSHPKTDCSHPEISDYKMELLTGMLMGDGCIGRQSKNPYFQALMIAEEFLEWLDNELGWLSTGTHLHTTAEESAKDNRDRNFGPNAKAENYHNIYRLLSRTHPDLSELSDWYATGKKVFPDDIELTPNVLKMWYVGDGHYADKGTSNHISIAMSNEIDRRNNIEQLFENIGFEVGNWRIAERNNGSKRCSLRFHADESQQLFDYMGNPPDGFAYKWPESYR